MDDFVCNQLTKLSLEEYIHIFKENEVDQLAFEKLTADDLRELLSGKVGVQCKIRKAIEELTLSPPSPDLPDEHFSCETWNNTACSTSVSLFQNFSAKSLENLNGKVLMYIDNSNIFINTQMHAAKCQKIRWGIRSDKRYRIDVGKLCSIATRGRETLQANLYGSEPPLLDTVWKSIRKKLINVKTHKKSPWTNKEKEIDTTLVADAVEGIIQRREKAGEVRAVILFTGDKDMLTVVRKALFYGWKVEIWSYKAALSNDLEKEARKSKSNITIFLMDDYFDSCTFLVTKWKKPYIPHERSMVLLFPEQFLEGKNETDKNHLITSVVKSSTALLFMPMMAQILHQKYNPTMPSNDIQISNKFAPFDPSSNSGNPTYGPYASMVLICYLKGSCHHQPEQNSKNSGNSCSAAVSPSYDFTKDVWSLKTKLQNSIPQCCDIITYQQYLQGVPENSNDNDEILSDIVDEILEEEDDPDIDFIVIEKKFRRKSQKYSDFCEHRYRCRHGAKCTYGHSPEEKEFFKAHPNARRHKYKTQLCTHALDKKCKYMNKTYLCPFAHDFYECMCPICGEVGLHWADECPKIFDKY